MSLLSRQGFRTSLGIGTIFTLALAGTALAQDETPTYQADPDEIVEVIVTIGTRAPGRTATDSPVPVDVLSSEAMTNTGHTETGRMIQVLAPSFNFSSSSISDGTDALRPATLRGLGPDQTLVLVNGKRRHGSALIHVNTSVGRGTAGTDLNAIPAAAIQRVEILRDGASAQYGSDAIAGVINLVLKDQDSGGDITGSYGEYDEGDGETWVVNFNQGFSIADSGFLNITGEYRDRGNTNRAGKTGVCQFVGSCAVAGDGTQVTSDPREVIFDRENFRIGDADSEQWSAVANLSIPFGEGYELYGFATYSDRDNESAGFYRRADQQDRDPTFRADGVTEVNGGAAFIPDGFLPKINTSITDYSINLGVNGEFRDWTWDLSAGYGENEFEFEIRNSLNASLVSATGGSPRSADAGTLKLDLFTVDFDIYRGMGWGGLAFGAAYREDGYKIEQGSLVSWVDFDTNSDGSSIGVLDAAGGIQVFPGFKPVNEVDEDRDAVSVYADVEYEAIERWLFGAAVRYEDYSDFGDTFNVKGTAAFHVNDMWRLRGAVSTGFRAPGLQQQFFNSTSTQFVSDPGGSGALVAQERGTFRNDSAVAEAIGIPDLKEEESNNYSAGVVFEPNDHWTVTVDYYYIEIDDRIVISGAIGTGLDPALDAALAAANATSAQFFLNAADTETDGVDIIVDYATELWEGDLSISLGANFTNTDVTNIKAPDSLSSIPDIQDLVFTSQDQSIIEDWQPEDRQTLTTNYSRGPWSGTLTIARFGEYTIEEGDGSRQNFDAKSLVDLQFRYAFDNGLTLKVGGNNIFDETPDTNKIGQSRSGTIVDTNGNTIVDSAGVFKFSRRAAPFGFNGAYWYGSASFSF